MVAEEADSDAIAGRKGRDFAARRDLPRRKGGERLLARQDAGRPDRRALAQDPQQRVWGERADVLRRRDAEGEERTGGAETVVGALGGSAARHSGGGERERTKGNVGRHAATLAIVHDVRNRFQTRLVAGAENGREKLSARLLKPAAFRGSQSEASEE